MSESIYIVSPETGELVEVAAVRFSDIGVRERQDLEEWVMSTPNLLGENLLIITSEFSQFKNSNRRLDVLALDEEGKLVVVELKLDAADTIADLQAIRYAAFCSTMTMEDVVRLLAARKKCTSDEATGTILGFINADDLPELDNQPRIILAAGSIDDQELTSSVLWLRTFNLDISCVELTPYRMADLNRIILVPKVIIPLPEAKDYLVRVEHKEAKRLQQTSDQVVYARLWAAVAAQFNQLDCRFTVKSSNRARHFKIPIGVGNIHYEWLIQKRDPVVRVALHFEGDQERNERLVKAFAGMEATISDGVNYPLDIGKFGKRWAHVQFSVPYDEAIPPVSLAPELTRVMALFIERTWPTLETALKQEGDL